MKNIDRIKSATTAQMAFFLRYFSPCECCPFDSVACSKIKNARDVPCEEGLSIWLESEERDTRTPMHFLPEDMR